MALKVIGAGLGRTGTMSLKMALERLGFGPCYHMDEIIRDPGAAKGWRLVGEGQSDWDSIFAGYQSTVDWPAARWWQELASEWEDAKVILSVRRDADTWFESTQRTIFNPATLSAQMPDDVQAMIETSIASMFGGRVNDPEICKAVYEAHNEAVIRTIPAERLLVYQAGAGWEPLCAFLGCPVPDEPYPKANNGDEFQDMVDRAKDSMGAAS